MNHQLASLLIRSAAIVTAFAAALARADVYCTASTYNVDGGAEVTYSTGNGFNVVAQGGAGGYGYHPDTAPGHQAFSLQTSISNSDLLSSASADNTTGTLRAAIGGSGGAGGNRAQIFDDITFHNPTGQPQTITVTWNVEGSLAVAAGRPGRATYHHDLFITGPGTILRFVGDGHLEGTPEHSSAETKAVGWISSSCEPRSGGFGGFNCNGTWAIPTGDFTVSVYALVDTTINCTEAGCEVSPVSANFGNTGKFGMTVPQGVSFSSTGGTLSAGSRMVNIATRAKVLGGDSVAIGGFIVTGNVPKKVIIRGIGPSLTGLGVPGALADPTLELLQGSTSLATNDNWRDSQQTEIQNTGIAPGNDLEPAIVRTLNPGGYTAILRGKNNGTGIGLVEVYDLDAPGDAKLANISTRAFVEAGDNVLIGGIIGGGNGSQPKVIIRAIGPSLTPLGVPNALQDPVLELHDKDGALIATNNDWQSDQAAAIQATGLAPSNAKESAIIATLQPTNYTAIVKGAGNTSGVGLVEVYHLQ